jgi:hypothetical protein
MPPRFICARVCVQLEAAQASATASGAAAVQAQLDIALENAVRAPARPDSHMAACTAAQHTLSLSLSHPFHRMPLSLPLVLLN